MVNSHVPQPPQVSASWQVFRPLHVITFTEQTKPVAFPSTVPVSIDASDGENDSTARSSGLNLSFLIICLARYGLVSHPVLFCRMRVRRSYARAACAAPGPVPARLTRQYQECG